MKFAELVSDSGGIPIPLEENNPRSINLKFYIPWMLRAGSFFPEGNKNSRNKNNCSTDQREYIWYFTKKPKSKYDTPNELNIVERHQKSRIGFFECLADG